MDKRRIYDGENWVLKPVARLLPRDFDLGELKIVYDNHLHRHFIHPNGELIPNALIVDEMYMRALAERDKHG